MSAGGASGVADPGLREGRHAGLTGQRRFHHVDRQSRAGAFAQAHTQRQQRHLAKSFEKRTMRGLRRDMARDRMVERAGLRRLQRGEGGGADKAVDHHRDAQTARAGHGPRHRGQFAPAETA